MNTDYLDRNLALETVRVTEIAALASSLHMGKGNEKSADQSAVNAMRDFLNELSISGKVVIGEGELDEAPMLFIGEKLGTGGNLNLDIAVDPLEGTNFVAKNLPGSLSVIAIAEKGNLFNAPETYMDKLAVTSNVPTTCTILTTTAAVKMLNNNRIPLTGRP